MINKLIWSDKLDQLVKVVTLEELDKLSENNILIYVHNEKNEHDKTSICFLVGATSFVIVEV